MEVKNANPTILNLSDLPTRQPAATAKSRRSPIDSIIPTYSLDPFTTSGLANYSNSNNNNSDDVASSGSDSDGGDDDDDVPERIDAQEIYGTGQQQPKRHKPL